MAINPPDGWSPVSPAVWGTDLLDATDQTHTGGTSIKFPSAGLATAQIRSDLQALPFGSLDGIAKPQYVEAWFRTDSVAAGTAVVVQVELYNAGKVLGTTLTLLNAILPGTNAWLPVRGVVNPTTASAFARLIGGKNGSATWNLWLSTLSIRACPRAFRATPTAVTSLTSGAFTLVTFATTDFDFGSLLTTPATTFKPSASSNFVNSKSLWHFDAGVTVTGLADANEAVVSLFVNGAEKIRGVQNQHGAAADVTYTVGGNLYLADNDAVDVRAFQNSGVAKNTVTATSFFSGHEIST